MRLGGVPVLMMRPSIAALPVVEHLHGGSDRGPMTLFATHYHV